MTLSSKSSNVLIGLGITTGIVVTGMTISFSIDKYTNQVAVLSTEVASQSDKINQVDNKLSELSDRVETTENRVAELEKVKYEARVAFIKNESGLPQSTINEIIYQSDSKENIDDTLLLAVAYTESRFNPDAVNNSSGATGMMQFLPSSAKYLADKHGIYYDYSALYDPTYSVKLSAIYINDLANEHGLYKALSKYGGEIGSTEYADKVWSRYLTYENKKSEYIKDYLIERGYSDQKGDTI